MAMPHCCSFLLLFAMVCDGSGSALPSSMDGGGSGAVANAPLSVVSVVSYGARGDGSTDDTAAIEAAITACVVTAPPHNGCVLYFPAGVYITTGIALQSFIHVKGDGWGTSVLQLKAHTAADVLTIPPSAFNFSINGLTLDGNASRGGRGHCLSVAPTPASPAEFNTANKQTATVNAQKWGHIEEVMFSHCSRDGIHISRFNYMLFLDNFYTLENGEYGVYSEGDNSGFTSFQIERNGVAGIRIDGANNRLTSGEVIWNGASNPRLAAVYVTGQRNLITAVETEDNYTSGFFDSGSDNEFIGCVSDSNGYIPRHPEASSLHASGFVIGGKGGVYLGDKVTSYRGRLPDGNFTTQWPYTLATESASRIDITYDNTNQPPAIVAEDSAAAMRGEEKTAGHAACIKAAGPPVVMGFCSTAVGPDGECACN
jgi:Pectate lyase superfamily protein